MIVTCASCLTKFNLDESKIPPTGAKVRCSRCHHVFYVTSPPETKEEIIENLESFAKYHEELMEHNQQEMKKPSPSEEDERERPSEKEEETFLFSEKISAEKIEQAIPEKPIEEEMAEIEVTKPKRMIQEKKRGPSLFFILLVILILLVFGFFYLWTKSGTSGKLYSLLEYPIQKATYVWEQIWGTEKEGLIVRDLNGYDEKIGEVPIYVIEGKVDNQSRFIKKHIKIKIVIFDQNRTKLEEKETVCGRIMSREELKNLPDTFSKGAMMIQPKIEKDMISLPKKTVPFMVVFKNLSIPAKEFQVEIVEAPNL
jgi:predicted Zn finger-like uncharacterized protein